MATFGKHSELLKWETDNLTKPENGNNENLIKPNNENLIKPNIWIELLLLKEADNNNNVIDYFNEQLRIMKQIN